MRVNPIVANYGLQKANSKANSRMQNSHSMVSFKVNPIKEILDMGAAASLAIAAKEAAERAKAQEDDDKIKDIPFPTGVSDINPFPNDDWHDTAY